MQPNNKNVDIFIYSHIPFEPQVTNPVYKVLTNTSEPIKTNLEVYRDYEGEDNIADKNLMFNEYTGFYWLWKNYDLKDYIGLNHYRRYYTWFDDVPDINKVFTKHNIILNEPIPLVHPQTNEKINNREWYDFWHNVEDYDIFKSVMTNKFPEFKNGLNRLEKADAIYNSSMFVMSRSMFLEYIDFIFKYLEEYQKETGLWTVEDCIKHVEENRDKYIKPHLPYYTVEIQARIIGYIAERAMNTFVKNGFHALDKKALIVPWTMA